MTDMTVSNSVNAYATTPAKTTTENTTASTAAKAEAADSKDNKNEKDGVVYEKSDEKAAKGNKLYNRDAIVSKLKADQESRIASMQSLVQNLLGKQRNLFDIAGLSDNALGSMNLAKTFRGAAAKIGRAHV